MVKKIQKSGIFSKIQKNHFFSKNLKILKIFFFRRKIKKNAIPLVLLIEEISLRPELSSPPRFRIQGGYPERYGRTNEAGRKSLCLILDVKGGRVAKWVDFASQSQSSTVMVCYQHGYQSSFRRRRLILLSEKVWGNFSVCDFIECKVRCVTKGGNWWKNLKS